MTSYEPPGFKKSAFNCPLCNAYAQQEWRSIYHRVPTGGFSQIEELGTASCSHCEGYSLWHFEKMIYPEDSGVPLPNPDLQEDIKQDYSEARGIVNKSPRGAAALLRLCIQKLCQQLGEAGKNINDDIASLVKKGLSPMIQQALDFVRVIGNNAVHPGQIDLKDDRDIAMKLFDLINRIAEVMITQPKETAKLYETLPESYKQQVEKRDKGSTTT